ncbi:MAG: hypothetical protein ACTSW1_03695 [Candidatus Hodarchaeales archaeon]
MKIELPRKVFRQSEIITVKIDLGGDEKSIKEVKLCFVGKEKTEFTMQSLVGRKGFHPGWSFILPSRHMREETEFLNEAIDLDTIKTSIFEAKIEVPENALLSYYGENARIKYTIELECKYDNGRKKKVIEEVLIDSSYKIAQKKESIKLGIGELIIYFDEPLLIGKKNKLFLSTKNLNNLSPIRIILKGTEILTASGITTENDVYEIPLAQISYDCDLNNVKIEFEIPSRYQHNYEGIQSRLEYFIEIHQILKKRGIIKFKEKLRLLKKLKVNLEYPVIDKKTNNGETE